MPRLQNELPKDDLYAANDTTIPAQDQRLVPTDVAIAIPEGYYAQIKPRSGLVLKHKITVDAGVIDQDYRGNVGILLVNRGRQPFTVHKGERIAQMVLLKVTTPPVEIVKTLPPTNRGNRGFGSTGLNVIDEIRML